MYEIPVYYINFLCHWVAQTTNFVQQDRYRYISTKIVRREVYCNNLKECFQSTVPWITPNELGISNVFCSLKPDWKMSMTMTIQKKNRQRILKLFDGRIIFTIFIQQYFIHKTCQNTYCETRGGQVQVNLIKVIFLFSPLGHCQLTV